MRVYVADDGSQRTAALREPENFKELSVELAPGVTVAPGDRIGDAVRFESRSHAWIAPGWLIESGGYASGPPAESYRQMVTYATGKGWVDEGSGELAAHVVQL